ncbi:LacI family DNA-binding transcriptional regulator [Microbacterium sp. NPDC055521]
MARVTITQVAARAGVSVASASRALNGRVASAETIAKVRRAAAELGYIADATAQSLKRGRTFQLAYAVADIGNPVYVEMMTAIQRAVSASGYRLILSSTGDAASSVDVVRDLSRGYVDGLIISPLRVTDDLLDALTAVPVPVVVLGRVPGDGGFDTVRADSLTAMRQVVDHVVGRSLRDLAFINGPEDTTPGAFRRDGFAGAIAAHPGVRARSVVAADFTIAAGYDAAIPLLRSDDRPQAVVAANDLIGVGVLRAAEDLGLSVPGDLAVTGIDDTELAAVVRPGLTSVDMGAAERGRVAAELLLARIADGSRPTQTVAVAPRLVVRGSTRPAAAQPGVPLAPIDLGRTAG